MRGYNCTATFEIQTLSRVVPVDTPCNVEFELRDHTADIGVAAFGETLADVFAAVAQGLARAMCDQWPDSGDRFSVSVSSESPEALLFDFLDELIYQRDVRTVLPVDLDVEISNQGNTWIIEGSARGVPLDNIEAREVKAVTYADMLLEAREDGWHAYVVFDV